MQSGRVSDSFQYIRTNIEAYAYNITNFYSSERAMRKNSILTFAFWVLLFALLCFHAGMVDTERAAETVSHLLQQEKNEIVKDEIKPKIAITFDDGPHPAYTPRVLDVLKEKDVKATFFLMGKSIAGNEEIVKRMAEEGHLIGNHTFDHVNLDTISEKEVCDQLLKTYNLIYEVTGKKTEYVRPPFGAWDKAKECNIDMIPVLWNIDTLDWSSQNVGAITAKVIGKVDENDIILMHDGYAATVTALGEIIDYLKQEGFDIVTVDELLFD